MLVEQIINGLTAGIIYSLVALGFTIIFASLDLVHFAQGEILMIGGFIGYLFYSIGVPFLAALLLTVVLTGGLGVVLERLVYRRILAKKDPEVLVICTIGMSTLLTNLALRIWGSEPRSIAKEEAFPGETLQLAGVSIQPMHLWIVGISLVVMALFWYLFEKTKIGLGMRTTAYSKEIAALMGVPVGWTVSLTFAIACGLAAAAGWLLSPTIFVQYNVGAVLGLKAFCAAVIGGMGSIPGAIVGGLFLGVAENIGAGYVDSGYKDAIAAIVMIGVLLMKPTGLFGTVKQEKV
ncbi:branched-chain amino acid ABC transporter permease [Brevibacillus sp. H7]|uniref:branched-chain amino acid ABC transporter permease n=1 Tax=Brevibacillus sp. H7 TaxID=3349138 RepID=UPI0038049368